MCFAAFCWRSSICLQKYYKLTRKTSCVLGTALELLGLLVQRRMLHKFMNIIDNTADPLNSTVMKQQFQKSLEVSVSVCVVVCLVCLCVSL